VSKKPRIILVATTIAALAGLGTRAAADGGSPARAATGHSAVTSSDKSEELQEVTVTAHRVDLAARVSKFVNEIAAVENGEGLPRWKAPVCPLVSGLPQEEGEFILRRVSEIARAAAVPLAVENCRPNLYILIHPEPKKLFQAMEKRNFAFTFGDDPPAPSVIDRFIATPQAVKVWYTSVERTPDGMPLQACPPYPKCTPGDPAASPFTSGVVWQLAHVFVVVDETRLKLVSRGQLADYVAMVALAELKPGAKLANTPTILKLFDGAPQAAPAGMTDWDQAFLKSLYATQQASRLQRSQIAHQIEREVAP
jgi:hypothetical protein